MANSYGGRRILHHFGMAIALMCFLERAVALEVNFRYTVTDPTPDNDETFGFYLDISGDRMAIAAPCLNAALCEERIHVFETSGGSWLAEITNPFPLPAEFVENFANVALNQDWLVIGHAGSSVGAGRVFIHDASTLDLVRTIEDPLNRSGGGGFGRALSLQGDRLLIGSFGHAHLIDLSTGLLIQVFEGPDSAFGISVALSDDRVLVGDNFGGNIFGEATLFDATTGIAMRGFNTPTPQAGGGNMFGSQVAIKDDTVVIGGTDGPTGKQGEAHVFHAGTGVLVSTLADPNPQTLGRFGSGIAIAEEHIVVGSNKSEAYVYDRTNGDFVRTITVPTQGAPSVDISEGLLLIGSPSADGATVGANRNTGAAHIYDFVELVDVSAPIADAGPDQALRPGDEAQLDGSGSSDNLTATEDLGFSWSLISAPAGSAASLSGLDIPTPSLLIDAVGRYEIDLVVTDEAGNVSAPDTVVINSDNVSPVAEAGTDQLITLGDVATLDGSNSNDPDGDALSFGWTIVSMPTGSSSQLMGSETSSPSIEPDVLGSYEIRLVVSDAIGPGESDSVVVTATIAADFDGDFDKDGSDYLIFRNSFGKCDGDVGFLPRADYTGDGCVRYDDYREWINL